MSRDDQQWVLTVLLSAWSSEGSVPLPDTAVPLLQLDAVMPVWRMMQLAGQTLSTRTGSDATAAGSDTAVRLHSLAEVLCIAASEGGPAQSAAALLGMAGFMQVRAAVPPGLAAHLWRPATYVLCLSCYSDDLALSW